MHNNFI